MTTQKRAELEEKYFGKRESPFGSYETLTTDDMREALEALTDAKKWTVSGPSIENLDDLIKAEVEIGTVEEVEYTSTAAAESLPGWKATMISELLGDTYRPSS